MDQMITWKIKVRLIPHRMWFNNFFMVTPVAEWQKQGSWGIWIQSFLRLFTTYRCPAVFTQLTLAVSCIHRWHRKIRSLSLKLLKWPHPWLWRELWLWHRRLRWSHSAAAPPRTELPPAGPCTRTSPSDLLENTDWVSCELPSFFNTQTHFCLCLCACVNILNMDQTDARQTTVRPKEQNVKMMKNT